MNESLAIYPKTEIEGYVGVVDGQPQFHKSSDQRGDLKSFDVYPTSEEALNRWHNVRKVRVVVYGEPVYAPENWGKLDE